MADYSDSSSDWLLHPTAVQDVLSVNWNRVTPFLTETSGSTSDVLCMNSVAVLHDLWCAPCFRETMHHVIKQSQDMAKTGKGPSQGTSKFVWRPPTLPALPPQEFEIDIGEGLKLKGVLTADIPKQTTPTSFPKFTGNVQVADDDNKFSFNYKYELEGKKGAHSTRESSLRVGDTTLNHSVSAEKKQTSFHTEAPISNDSQVFLDKSIERTPKETTKTLGLGVKIKGASNADTKNVTYSLIDAANGRTQKLTAEGNGLHYAKTQAPDKNVTENLWAESNGWKFSKTTGENGSSNIAYNHDGTKAGYGITHTPNGLTRSMSVGINNWNLEKTTGNQGGLSAAVTKNVGGCTTTGKVDKRNGQSATYSIEIMCTVK
jgi:hypothetical protein